MSAIRPPNAYVTCKMGILFPGLLAIAKVVSGRMGQCEPCGVPTLTSMVLLWPDSPLALNAVT